MHCDRENLCDDGATYIEVCAIEGAPAFICGACGHVTVDMLSRIESDLAEIVEEGETYAHGEGVHTYEVTFMSAQTGEFGRVEIPEHFELEHIRSRSL